MWGNPDNLEKIKEIIVRSPEYFNWSTIFFLAVVVLVYTILLKNKDYKSIIAGITLYSIHWFYEIMNAVIAKVSGAPLWAVTNDSTSFILLIGVSVELSFMFSLAGIVAWKSYEALLPKVKILGIPTKWIIVIVMSILFSCIEIFLAWTGKFLWYYTWWGAIPVCITTYVPFFIGAMFLPEANPKFKKIFIPSLVGINIILLAILIPLGII
ncbi:MAG: hypothetical protein WCR97_02475 [Bacilli bacterium]